MKTYLFEHYLKRFYLKPHMTPPTPRTDAAWKAVSSDPYIDEMFGMDVLAETMESMELEIIDLKARLQYVEKRAEKAEEELIDIKLFGITQPQP